MRRSKLVSAFVAASLLVPGLLPSVSASEPESRGTLQELLKAGLVAEVGKAQLPAVLRIIHATPDEELREMCRNILAEGRLLDVTVMEHERRIFHKMSPAKRQMTLKAADKRLRDGMKRVHCVQFAIGNEQQSRRPRVKGTPWGIPPAKAPAVEKTCAAFEAALAREESLGPQTSENDSSSFSTCESEERNEPDPTGRIVRTPQALTVISDERLQLLECVKNVGAKSRTEDAVGTPAKGL